MTNIGENIKKFRIFRKMTQVELGEAVNRSKNVVSNWERGDNTPDLDTLEKICRVLDVTPNMMFGWDRCPEFEQFQEKIKEYNSQLIALGIQKQLIEGKIKKLRDEISKEIAPLRDDYEKV